MGNQYKSEEVKPVPFEQIVERMQKGGASFPRELSPGMWTRVDRCTKEPWIFEAS